MCFTYNSDEEEVREAVKDPDVPSRFVAFLN